MPDQTKYTAKLTGSRILVIGGSSGIGFCVAEACTENGALVTISSSNKTRVGNAVEKIKASYPSAKDRVFGLTVDLSKPDTLENDLKTLLEGTVKEMGGEKLDHVVFTAGDKLAIVKLEDMTMQNIVAAGQIRFFAPLLLAKFLPTYLHSTHKSSYTITTGSIAEKPSPDWSVVGSYAGGHQAMVRALALDMKPIRVNGVSPGAVDTELWDHHYGKEQKEGIMQGMEGKMATGRVGRPEDVAETYLGILRDANMDGSMVQSNGGGMLM
ncbi:short chain dehydrogenase [Clathrospora elynae]|uniref:Short chain dehydrogenase n=1 Tax=Clathrospora elynae TaxID=706981 RepID=A0A6A5SUB7_9PLEO|nr:short chain dehydrogenase [Clathrospora elynae]